MDLEEKNLFIGPPVYVHPNKRFAAKIEGPIPLKIEIAPQGLCGQLKEGGRLLGVFAMTQPSRAVIVTRTHGDLGHRTLFDAAAPVLPGLERVPAFVF